MLTLLLIGSVAANDWWEQTVLILGEAEDVQQ